MYREHHQLTPVTHHGSHEEVLDETPWEHHERRMHDSEAHYWTTRHEPALYDRLREHYPHAREHHSYDEFSHDGDYHHDEEVVDHHGHHHTIHTETHY